jgi:hypothetical protein
MTTQELINKAAVEAQPDEELEDRMHHKYRLHFIKGAQWALSNLPIAWKDPRVEMPPLDSEQPDQADFEVPVGKMSVLCLICVREDKGFTNFDVANYWTETEGHTAHWGSSERNYDAKDVIGWAPLTIPNFQ